MWVVAREAGKRKSALSRKKSKCAICDSHTSNGDGYYFCFKLWKLFIDFYNIGAIIYQFYVSVFKIIF